MFAEIISIGDELLFGQRVNTNARFICSELAGAGIAVKRIIACADNVAAIREQFRESLGRAMLVVVTGGLGPTRDDMTKESAQQLLNRELVLDRQTYERTLERYTLLAKKPVSSLRDNAMVIRDSIVVRNDEGLAPGMIIACKECFQDHYLVLLPGVPREMKSMMRNSVLPYFSGLSGTVIVHSNIKTTGIGEASLAKIIVEIEKNLPAGTSLAYLPHTAGVSLRVSSIGTDSAPVEHDNREVTDAIVFAARPFVYATADISLEELIGSLLLRGGLTIATAESCTGGLIAGRLTDVPGSSGYFEQGFVVYSNVSKEKNLGVRRETIETYGAVSEEVAAEMAEGCLQRCDVHMAVSSTGIAGPDGGTELKPAGMVCLGLAIRKEGEGTRIETETFVTRGDRLQNKLRFSEAALRIVWKALRS